MKRGSSLRRVLPMLALGGFLGAGVVVASGEVLVLSLDTIIHPVASEFVAESIAEAERVDAEAVVIEISTPGGLMTSTRKISTAILGSKVPVIVYVSPSGVHAASAGFFILMSGDIAAMAPGTNTGAAHPVSGEGGDIEGDMGDKVEEDAAANIRTLAARNDRNVELAEAAVLESRSFTEEEALAEGLIDIIAPSVEKLLEDLDGREVQREGETITLATRDAPIRRLEWSPVQRFLAIVAHPNVAYILLSLGFLGLYFEFANPGVILPGVAGSICLILGFYALSVLPLNYAGVALILLAVVLLIAEIKVTSMGILTIGGVVSLVVGSLMLFKSPDPALQVSLSLILGVAMTVALLAVFLMTLVVRTFRTKVTTGRQGLIGKRGVVKRPIEPSGKVFVHGELWDAVAEHSGEIDLGEEIEVVAVEGMCLRVREIHAERG